MYDVILYYNFQSIDDPERFCKDHKQKCLDLCLLGRVYIAGEGINGTLAGAQENIHKYKEYVQSLSGFEKTEFKEDQCDYIPFRKLVVKVRPEMVTLKAPERIDLSRTRGKRLMPDEWKKVLESDEEYVLIDTRNDYEWEIGHFEGAVLPDLENFFDFPQWIDQANIDRDKKILMYCTGGIRCEKVSVLMEMRGYKNVFQLHGGIINYGKKEGGAHFKGKCFVFDDRLAVPVNKDDQAPISHCKITGDPCDTYINCANPDCNKLFVCTVKGALEMEGCCGKTCMKSPRKRPLDPDNIFAPTHKWYDYFEQKA
jgi:UPF0176 protein